MAELAARDPLEHRARAGAVAKKLAELPRLDEELRHGRVTYSQVRAICRGATPASEEAFIEMAKNTTASQLERIVRGVEGTRALDEPDDVSRAPSRWVFQRPMNDGSFRVEAQLRADEAARVMEAIPAAGPSGSLSELGSL